MISRLVKKKGGDLFFKKFTLIPANVDNMHWVLAILHPVRGRKDEDDKMASLFGPILEDEGVEERVRVTEFGGVSERARGKQKASVMEADVDNGGEVHRAHVYILDSLCERLGFQLNNAHQDVVTHIEELLNRVAQEHCRGWGLIEAIGKAVRVCAETGGRERLRRVGLHLARVFLKNPARFCYLMTADGRGTSAEDVGRDWQAEEFTNLRGVLLERIEEMVAAREREEADGLE
ncbi:hypothetical protein DFH07DRAFT_970271 [Mycena maculata]|nr:hypothetical protein DFH07DRAFT_970271 [Mycena maculata]